jgi:ABC-type transport system involved in multi-copper enzyme maturation permease subunit
MLGPVFRYELYSIARRARYFWLRGVFGLLLLFVMWMSYSSVAWRGGRLTIDDAAQLASAFFLGFAWVSTLAVLAIAPALSSGVIATERERRTIEYLFATDLSNSEIVLSKLAARLLLLGLLLLTALPVLAIFRLLGGISGDRLLGCFLMLASTGLAVTATSIAISVWSPRGRDALSRVYLVMIAVLIVPMLLSAILFGTGIARSSWFGDITARILELAGAINPLGTLFSMSRSVGFDMQVVWRMLIAHAVLSVALILLAVSAVRRVHLRSAGSSKAARSRRRFRWELPRWRRPLGKRPMLWKEVFARTAATRLGILGRIAAALAVGGLLVSLAFAYADAWWRDNEWNFFEETALIIGAAIGSGTLLLCGARAASLVTYEKERDTWTSILSTPMSGREILFAKLAGNLYACRWLAVVLLLIWSLAVTLNYQFILAVPLLFSTFVLLATFATLVGLLYSLRLSSSLRASAATMATLFFIGGGYVVCCCMPFFMSGPGNDAEHFVFASCAPLLLYAPGELFNDQYSDTELVSNYTLGIAWYSAITAGLWATLVSSFEDWSGRIAGGLRRPEEREMQIAEYKLQNAKNG